MASSFAAVVSQLMGWLLVMLGRVPETMTPSLNTKTCAV
jgi:hypothetical protein